jgi:hypothetical protein
MRRLMGSSSVLYSLGFECFDSSVCGYAVAKCWDILERRINHISDPVAFNYAKENFLRTRVVMPDGRLYECTTGVPTGSMFTNLIDRMVNFVLMQAAVHRFTLNVEHVRVHNDDSAFFSNVLIEADVLKSFFAQFGMLLNAETSIVTTNHTVLHFLGRNVRGSSLDREDFVLLSLALYPENRIESAEESVSRLAELSLDSCLMNNKLVHLYRLVCERNNIQGEDFPLHFCAWDSKMFVVAQ